MPKVRRPIPDLTPEQIRSSQYLQKALWKWRDADYLKRGAMTQREITSEISKYFPSGHVMAQGTLSSHLSGKSIPNVESAWAWIKFANLDVIETFEALGLEIPFTFPLFYDYIERVSESEEWPKRDELLEKLSLLKENLKQWREATLKTKSPWYLPVAFEVMVSKNFSTIEKALYLAELCTWYRDGRRG